jgi:hypothetical protein
MISKDNLPLDIETIPTQDEEIRAQIAAEISPPGNYKSDEAIAKWWATEGEFKRAEAWKKTSFDGAYGHIAVIGFAFDDEEPTTLYSENYVKDEPKIIRAFHEAVNTRMKDKAGASVRVIGHNVLNFDMRFIRQRSILLGIQLTPFIRWGAREWDDGYVFDTSFQWAGRDGVKLAKLCEVMGIAGKGEEIGEKIDGSMVWEFVQRGEIAKVAKYCGGDVSRVWEIFKKMTAAQGWNQQQEAA